MAADQTHCFGGYVNGLRQLSVAGGGILRLVGVEMDGLRIWLCRHGGTVGDINVNA